MSKVPPSDISIFQITLDYHDRERLYERTARRIGAMLDEGLLEEARTLYDAGVFSANATAAQAIGYKELLGYLRGECTLSEALEALRLATRHYAKRQLTWFRAHTPSYTLYMDTEDGTPKDMPSLIEEILTQIEPFYKG